MLEKIDKEWRNIDGKKLQRRFEFKGFLSTMSFVNAVAWLAQKQNHHPEMEVSFKACQISLTTHDAGNAVTEKDFQLAQSIDQLLS